MVASGGRQGGADLALPNHPDRHQGARIQEVKTMAQGLPLYTLDGISAVTQGTPVVFKIDHNDKRAGMLFGHLPEYGDASTASACLPHAHLASTRKTLQREMQRCLRGMNQAGFAIVASVAAVEERSVRGVDQLAEDHQNQPNLGLEWNVTLDRRQVSKEEEGDALSRWREASRLASIVDQAAVQLGESPLHMRQRWMYDLYSAMNKEEDEEDEEGLDDSGVRDPVLRVLVDLALHSTESTAEPPTHLARPVVSIMTRNGMEESKAVATAARRSLASFLKPSPVRLEASLSHPSLEVLRAAIHAALSVPPPPSASSVGWVDARVVGPPRYLLSTTTLPHESQAAVDYLERAVEAAQRVLEKGGTGTVGGTGTGEAKEMEGSDEVQAAEVQDGEGGGEDLRLLQPTLNIGLVGHVAHGKSSVCRYLSGKRTQQHSTEHKLHGATIRLGYANCRIHRCSGGCGPPDCYTTSPGDTSTPGGKKGKGSPAAEVACRRCGGSTHVVRHVSFVDCPGHHDLVTTMLTGAAAFDAALLVVAANEQVPAKQTACHLEILTRLGLEPDQVCILQNKAELLFDSGATTPASETTTAGGTITGLDKAIEGRGAASRGQVALRKHGEQCRAFTRGSAAHSSPIIPVSAHLGHNMDQVARWLAEVPERSPEAVKSQAPRFMVLRSFDANIAGSPAANLKGGVVGGALLQGNVKPGDVVEVRPGLIHRPEKQRRKKSNRKGREAAKTARVVEEAPPTVQPILARVRHVKSGNLELPSASPGGLTALELDLDPALTRADGLAGMLVGRPGTLPPIFHTLGVTIEWVDPALLGHDWEGAGHPGEDSDTSSSSSSEDEDEKVGTGRSRGLCSCRKGWVAPAVEVGQAIRLHVGSSCCRGQVTKVSKTKSNPALGYLNKVTVVLSSPVCAPLGSRLAVELPDALQGMGGGSGGGGRVVAAAGTSGGGGWKLVGFGTLDKGKECSLTGPATQVPEEPGVEQLLARPPRVAPPVVAEDMMVQQVSGDGKGAEEVVSEREQDERLRTRFTEHLVDENPDLLSRRRVKVPPLDIAKDGGARVVWTNFAVVCKAIDRPPSHIAAFFREEGGLGNVALAGDLADEDAVQLRIFTRAFRTIRENVGSLLAKYCARYVCCKQCRSARTTLTRNDDANMHRRSSTNMILTCRDCLACSFPKAL